MQLPHNAVVLVADGRKMLFLRNTGDAANPELVVETAREQDNPSNSEQATDRAGRTQSNVASGRSGYEETDFHQLEEDRFAADAADLLKRRALTNDFDSLVIVAPPKTLGELRKHYHVTVSDRLKGEIDKDLTGHTIPDITKALQAA